MVEKQTVKCSYCDKQLKNTKRSIGAHIGYWHKEKATELYRKEKTFSIVCKECNVPVANSNNVLGRHLRKVHKMEFPDYLVKYEYSGQWPICGCGCGEKLAWKKGGFSKFIKEHTSRGKLNPMYGKRGKNSPNYGKVRTAEHRANYSRAVKKRWRNKEDKFYDMFTAEYRRKLSDRAIKLLEQNKIGPQAPYKTEYKLNPFTGKKEWMHSSWESAFLDACVEQNLSVTKAHSIRIDYTDEQGNQRQYVPDFLGEGALFEVKGHENAEDLLKYQAAEKWCGERGMEFVVLGKDVFLRR